MKRLLILIPLALTGCVTGARTALQCQHQAGPQPNMASSLFGIAGAVWATGQDDTRAWNARYHACVVEQERVG
jgi:hypothetical protein